jgi:hypothetical protein
VRFENTIFKTIIKCLVKLMKKCYFYQNNIGLNYYFVENYQKRRNYYVKIISHHFCNSEVYESAAH